MLKGGVKETLEEFQGIVFFRDSGLLWKVLGEGFWCPQVGGSKHMCDTWTRERVPLTGPSGLGVPRPLGAGGLVHPPEVWEVLLKGVGYGLPPAPPSPWRPSRPLPPSFLSLPGPEITWGSFGNKPSPSRGSESLVAGWNPPGRLTSSQVALMGSRVERPFPAQLRPRGPFQARGLEGRASKSRATPNFPAPHAGGRGREGLLGRPSPSARCRL